jgi:uncharacterized protein (TIGR02271 family)
MNRRTITGVFESIDAADRAAQDLAMHIGGVRAAVCSTQHGPNGLSSLNVPDEDRESFNEAIRRGHAVVSAEVPQGQFETAADVLEAAGALDLEGQEAEWRSQGWNTSAMGGMTGAGASTITSLPGTMASRGVDQVAGTNISGAHPENETRTGLTGAASSGLGVAGTAQVMAGATGHGEEAIPIVEEQLRIGKREVEHGRVRIRSYVVETPVEEQVQLHQEHVDVERRAVKHTVTNADHLFQERTIEATESTEEAVIAKEVRVTEEITLRKHEEERIETVRDTVRRTEVEVEDERQDDTAAGRSGTGSGTASGGIATPGTGTGMRGTQRGSGSGGGS